MMMLVTGLVGVVLMMTFLGIMVWWVKALPLTLIVVGVVVLMLFDLVQTLRYGNTSSRR